MRIAAVSNSRVPSLTANSIQAMKVCDALAEAGHDVHLFVPAEATKSSWDDLARRYAIRRAFPIVWLPSRRVLRRLDLVWYAHAAARRLGADLIYTWLPQTAALESHLKRPTVLEMHADVAGAFGAWWLRRFWSGSGRRLLVTTTHALRGALERSTGMVFPKASVVVAPNGVDLERYANVPDAAEARARLHLAEAFTAGFTGHFYPGRGTDLLFELARRMPDVKFLWVGGTPQTVAEWRSRLSAAGQSNVTLTGFVDNSLLPLYQAAADVLLMPYGRAVAASSGQDIAEVINPMKMFEYMAAGRAIITADLPVIREVLDETRAVFCAPGNVEDWMSAILGLKAAADRRLRLAQNGRREVETCTWRAREERILQALELG